MSTEASHLPVMEKEVIGLLRPERGGIFIDGTLGLGGHSAALLGAGKSLRLIGIDQDEAALRLAKKRLGERIEYVQGNFRTMVELLKERKVSKGDGILLDVGVSSFQLDTAERGFSFQEDGPLDMRMDQENPTTAANVLAAWSESKLADLFWQYGEERLSRKIARLIVEQRKKQPFTRTAQLAQVVVSAYHPAVRYKRPHPATRTFQALRIAVNQEIEALEEGVQGALSLLAPGGVLVVISFHSLEDRPVKHLFREAAESGQFELLTKKPLVASHEEASKNPRSRSAKLRAIRRIN